MTDRIFRSAKAAASIVGQYKDVLDQWPVPRTERHVATRFGSTFVIASGPETGPPVILLHGAQANSAAWMPDVSQWSRKFRLFAVDMIGEAGLSAPVRPDLAGDAHALWLDDVLQGLGLVRTTFVGTSLGGWLALDYANRRPEAVEALVLICPGGIGRQTNFLLKAFPLVLLGPWGQRKIRELVFGPAPDVLPDSLRPFAGLMDRIAKAVRPRVITMPRLTDGELARLTMPILAIVGGRDALLDSHDTRNRLERNVPQAEICFIEEGYHFLPGHTERIMDFLERVALARPRPLSDAAAGEGSSESRGGTTAST